MVKAVEVGALTLDKLEAMTCVCSVGLDMIALPGDVSAETISAIIADEAAIGMINKKTTAVRVIPAIGKKAGRSGRMGRTVGWSSGYGHSSLFIKNVCQPWRSYSCPTY